MNVYIKYKQTVLFYLIKSETLNILTNTISLISVSSFTSLKLQQLHYICSIEKFMGNIYIIMKY